ncbi:hypothetical protein [Tateyamaria sp. SN6-1]|uniref:hypothetical protein n=1 Tax=Tateyamaria sp. SN6-1 TaxID=3092148 RepID=UPI0039F45189
MNRTMIDLLVWGNAARRYGCGLNPALERAILADVQFPSRAASPQAQHPIAPEDLPEGVTPLPDRAAKTSRKGV